MPAPPPAEIREQVRESRRLSESNSGTFHYAFRWFPQQKRDALHVIYRFCRLVDDAVDADVPEEDKRRELDRLEDQFHGDGEGEPWEPLEWVRDQYDIPDRYFQDLIAGARGDIGSVRIPDYESLDRYCYQVAGTVGLMTLHVMGFNGPCAKEYSLAMGRAFQLTNILRDVEEDRRRDRCYVPADLLEAHEATGDWESGDYTRKLRDALRELGRRARLNYRKCLPLFDRVEDSARFPLAVMTSAYSWYLHRIEQMDYDVQSRSLSFPGWMLPPVLWRSWRASRGRAERCLTMC